MSNINQGIRELSNDELAVVSGGTLSNIPNFALAKAIDHVVDHRENAIDQAVDKFVDLFKRRGR